MECREPDADLIEELKKKYQLTSQSPNALTRWAETVLVQDVFFLPEAYYRVLIPVDLLDRIKGR